MKPLAIALLALPLLGCQPVIGDTYHITIRETFSASDQQAARDAIAMWQLELGDNLHITGIDIGYCQANGDPLFGGGMGEICIQPCSTQWLNRVESGNESIIGATERYSLNNAANVFVPVDRDAPYDQSYMTLMMAHETGHAFGLQHVAGNNLMYWVILPNLTGPTCNDSTQYLDLRNQSSITTECPKGGSFTYYH
jgi:hypothetical protein